MKRWLWPMVFFVTLAALRADPAMALAPICILKNDSAGLQNAVANAASSGVSTVIEVEQGTYTIPPNSWYFSFFANQDVALLGGFVPGTNCQSRALTASPNTSATNTVLDGKGVANTSIFLYATNGAAGNGPATWGTLTFEGFEVRNLRMNTGASNDSALGFDWNGYDGYSSGIVFRYNWVHDNQSSGSIVDVFAGAAVTFVNNLVVDNSSAYTVVLESSAVNAAPWRIINNTIAQNSGRGLSLEATSYVQLFNNILYGNSSTDLVGNNTAVELHADTYGTSSGSNIVNEGGALSNVDPKYDANYHLVSGSGSLNTGAAFGAVLPVQDLDGNARQFGSRPDRGAFESPNGYDETNFLVNDSDDLSAQDDPTISCQIFSSKCTLREAILEANAATTPGRYIRFNFGTVCPQLITLNSPLPPINAAMMIDGFSQPGSSMNTVALDSGLAPNPSLCVIVQGKIASHVSSALVATSSNTNAQLEVRGITFEGFTGAAIALSQGSYHWIHGNSFGIDTDGNALVFSGGDGVYIDGSAYRSTVGGPSPADMNMFGKMTDTSGAAVSIGATTVGHFGSAVLGNLIGVAADLQTVIPNAGYGILLTGSSYTDVGGNTVLANAKDGISVNSGNTNWLHDNAIGTLATGSFSAAMHNGGGGITVRGSSSQNHIGAFDADARTLGASNMIQNNQGPGVWIESGAGIGNTVLGNAIGLNGPFSTGGDLAIDLGVAGTPLSTGGSGVPNGAQAAPSIYRSYLIGSATMQVELGFIGTLGDTLRVDFYRNLQCDSNGFGPALIPIQTYSVTYAGGVPQDDVVLRMPLIGSSASPAYVSATITDTVTGNTSQISNCATLLNDRVFANGFDASVSAF